MSGRRLCWALALLACLGALSGCNESAPGEGPEPGVYQGSRDPLLEKAGAREYGERLRERLRQVQTDR